MRTVDIPHTHLVADTISLIFKVWVLF